MKKRTLSRRAMLTSLGGTAIALPLLEIMLDAKPAAAAPGPPRYLVLWGGQSMGADGDPLDNDFVPNSVGPNYDLKSATHTYAKPGRYTVAVKVIDIFGNDTMTLLPVNVG